MTTSSSDSVPVVAPRRLAVDRCRRVRELCSSSALGVYGRLEPDRALVWTLEELGELAQAVRRGEGRARLEEELGQLTAWMLCLANILDVDLAAAVESAIREEIDRQLAKYGRLTPYRSGRARP